MSETSHTPGPWRAEGSCIRSSSGLFVASPIEDVGRMEPAEADANARLIAAAPDLLEAVKAARLVLAGEEMTKQSLIDALAKSQAAIAKAEGRTE